MRGLRGRVLLVLLVLGVAAAAVVRLSAADIHYSVEGDWKHLVDDSVVEAARSGARGSAGDGVAAVAEESALDCEAGSFVVKAERAASTAVLRRLRELGSAQVMGKQDDHVLLMFHGTCAMDVQAEMQQLCSGMMLDAQCADVAQYPLPLKIADRLLDIAARNSVSSASVSRAAAAAAAPPLLLQLNAAMTSQLVATDVQLALEEALKPSSASQVRVQASYLAQQTRDQHMRGERSLKRHAVRELLRGHQVESCQLGTLSWDISASKKYATVQGFEDATCALVAATRLAASPLVAFVEEQLQPVLFNNNDRWVMQSFVDGKTPFWDVGLNGTGQVVGIADTGLDQDSCYFRDPDGAVPATMLGDFSFDLTRRKVVQYVRMTDTDGVDYENGHGTHVAGTAAGQSLGSDGTYNGLAFGAKIAFFDLALGATAILRQPSDLGELFDHAYAAGARVHSDSWGYEQSTLNYDPRSQQVDAYMHSHSDVLFIFAAGNQGSLGAGTVAPPASSKNALAVGATRAGTSANQMVPGSSQGPAPDGRIKPDVVAPGGTINSAAASALVGGAHTETCGVVSKSGTSMATPAVSAAALLVREYFESGYYPSTTRIDEDSRTLSGAMLKAILVNSGRPIGGGTAFPGNLQGQGRVQLDAVLPFGGAFKLLTEERTCSGAVGEEFVFPLDVRSSHVELSATLTWMDPPGAASTSKNVINDIHIAAERDGTIFYPNGLAAPDSLNNVQRVVIPTWNLHNGDAIDLVVSCSDIVDPPQTFAIALTGYFDWLNDTYNYTSAGMFQPTPAPTPAPTSAPPPTPAPTLAPPPEDDDEFEFQSFNSWASSVEGSTIISGGVLVVIASAIIGYRSCVPKRTKDKLAARALARAVAEYRQDEQQFFQELEQLRTPVQSTPQPDVYVDRSPSVSVDQHRRQSNGTTQLNLTDAATRQSRRPASTRAQPVSPISPASPTLLVLRDDSPSGDGPSRSRSSRRYSTGSASSRQGSMSGNRRASHRIEMGDAQVSRTQLRDDVDVSRRDHLNYIRDSIY